MVADHANTSYTTMETPWVDTRAHEDITGIVILIKTLVCDAMP